MIKIQTESLIIAGLVINKSDITDEISYEAVYRLDVLKTLEEWICQEVGDNIAVMQDDREYLEQLEDTIIFSSLSTNSYIAYSQEPEEFIDICFEIIKASTDIEDSDIKEILKSNAIEEQSYFLIEVDNKKHVLKDYETNVKEKYKEYTVISKSDFLVLEKYL